MIPLTRLQHVDLSRGPLERRFGVASLEVFTAGTQSASHEIPHLQSETGFQLREDLVEAAGIQGQ
jgi:membrane protein YdbS with pleckstrin-like domain